MDIATVMGLLSGTLLIVYTVLSTEGASVRMFVDYPSLALVIGGATAAAFISEPLSDMLGLVRVIRNAFRSRVRPAQQIIKDLVHYAEVARRDGILSLENLTAEMEDPFLVKSVRLAVDGTDPDQMERILTAELDAMAERHSNGRRVLDVLGKYAPAYGMIGTLLGLVVMLNNMSDPDKLGPGMAVALITTLYGAVMANFVCLPLSDKLAYRSKEELALKELTMRGLLSIQSGDSPRVVEQKLQSYLPARLREPARSGETRRAA